MKISEIIQMLERDGWYPVKSKSGHRQYKHPIKTGRVTVPVHGRGRELPPKTLKSILRQAGLE